MNNKDKFDKYKQLLIEWSAKMNLVAPSTLDNIETRHFADSAQLADVLPTNVNIVDLGSGAGFPGIVLAILGWNVTCIESIGKKAQFLNAVKKELNLTNLTIFNGRVEDYVKTMFDTDVVFTARAFAPLVKILDYTRSKNSRLFLLKGRQIESEIAAAKKKHKFKHTLIPSKTGDGYIIIIQKDR